MRHKDSIWQKRTVIKKKTKEKKICFQTFQAHITFDDNACKKQNKHNCGENEMKETHFKKGGGEIILHVQQVSFFSKDYIFLLA